MTVIYLGALLPTRSSHPGSGRASLCAPIPVLLRIEFTATDSSQPSGALLPHLSTLTSSSQASHPVPRRFAAGYTRSAAPPLPAKPKGVFAETQLGSLRRSISVALFLGSPPAGVTRYPCPVEPGLSSRTAFRPGRAAVQRTCDFDCTSSLNDCQMELNGV